MKTEEWRADVSATVNDHEGRIRSAEHETVAVRSAVDALHSTVSGLSNEVADLSVPLAGTAAVVDTYDAGLKMCSVLVEQG